MTADDRWMGRALELAERGRGYVEPNPLVGAVVVRDGVIVGEGWHGALAGRTPRSMQLRAAGDAAFGATLYVTLEPCCHHGKTPPCTDTILHAGIKRVVAAMLDPFPQVAGKGVEILRAAGIDVAVGVESVAAARLNAPYLTLVRRGRPYVHAKWAMSLDGKIATRTGDSKWISGDESREKVHELRGRMDAILVGSGTVRADDALLTARPPGPRSGSAHRPDQFRRVAGRVSTASQRRRGAGHSRHARWPWGGGAVGRLRCLGTTGERRRPSVSALLAELGKRRMTNLLVEGGAEILGSFRDARLIDMAPCTYRCPDDHRRGGRPGSYCWVRSGIDR